MGQSLDLELTGMFLARLKAEFPDDGDVFSESTGANAIAYLTAEGNNFNLRVAERLVALLLEYEPLTEPQRRKQTPDGQRRWDEEVREIADPVFQGIDWLAIRPRIKTAPRIVRPGPVD